MHQHKYIQTMRPTAFPWLPCVFLALLMLAASALAEAGTPGKRAYQTGYPTIVKLTGELHQALDKTKRQQISAQPVLLDEANVFCLGQAPHEVNTAAGPAVQISAGCVELLNTL